MFHFMKNLKKNMNKLFNKHEKNINNKPLNDSKVDFGFSASEEFIYLVFSSSNKGSIKCIILKNMKNKIK